MGKQSELKTRGLLWVKTPGESDGEYDGAPPAGAFWPDGARRLIGYEELGSNLSYSTAS